VEEGRRDEGVGCLGGGAERAGGRGEGEGGRGRGKRGRGGGICSGRGYLQYA